MKSKHLIGAAVVVNLLLLGAIGFLLFSNPQKAEFGESSVTRKKLGENHVFASDPDLADSKNTSSNLEEPDYSAVQMPAAMAEMDPGVFMTTGLQVAEWETLQEEFINKVANKLPTNAAEWELWESARQQSDEMFRIKFGEEIYQKQLQAAAQENQVAFQ